MATISLKSFPQTLKTVTLRTLETDTGSAEG